MTISDLKILRVTYFIFYAKSELNNCYLPRSCGMDRQRVQPTSGRSGKQIHRNIDAGSSWCPRSSGRDNPCHAGRGTGSRECGAPETQALYLIVLSQYH